MKKAESRTKNVYGVFIIGLHSGISFNPIQDGNFRVCSRIAGGGQAKSPPVPKIFHTYPTMMKIDTVIPYQKKIRKIYESRDTSPEFC